MVLEMERKVAHLQNTTALWHEDNLVSGYPKSNSARSLLVKSIYRFIRFQHQVFQLPKTAILSFSKTA
jgi:hypothetical protein